MHFLNSGGEEFLWVPSHNMSSNRIFVYRAEVPETRTVFAEVSPPGTVALAMSTRLLTPPAVLLLP